MDKIELEIVGISANPTGNNAYALILEEVEGRRRLPIVIGAFEAQAIALELEGVKPPRPLTHDLLKNVIDKFGGSISEVFINDLNDGTFYSLIIINSIGLEIDARPSDAIALALRFGCPIFIREDILNETAVIPHIEDEDLEKDKDELADDDFAMGYTREAEKSINKADKLQKELEHAIENEDYEKAATIRDEIRKYLEN